MKLSFDIDFNGRTGESLNILPVKRPNIPAPERRYETITIPGRDGDFHIDKKTYEAIEIPIEFNFMIEPEKWGTVYRSAKKWLTGSGELTFMDDAKYFYKVSHVKITESERTSLKIGNLTATFYCEPFAYMKEGKREISPGTIYNPGYTAHPVYFITGEGNCVITVNGNTFTANVGQNMTIDSDLGIAYRETDMMNTSVSGDYESLWLEEGENIISVSSGFNVKIVPNWRYI